MHMTAGVCEMVDNNSGHDRLIRGLRARFAQEQRAALVKGFDGMFEAAIENGARLTKAEAIPAAERARVAAVLGLTDTGILPAEAERHGDYREEFVTHVDTNTKAQTKRNRLHSPLAEMWERGQLTDDQFAASTEIANVAEMIERAVSVRGASLEARVDNSGAGRDALIESLGRIRLEVTYSAWREQLPMPRRLVLDMLLTNRSLVATASIHGVNWRKARKWMIAALDRWIEFKERTWKAIDAGDVEWVYARLGEGVLLPPLPKAGLVGED